ncbi:MAG: hypothetical protein ACREOQ_08360 [Gemmatimonadales bacterium]
MRDTVGFVWKVKGEWLVGPAPPRLLVTGDTLFAGDTIRRGQKGFASDLVEIVLRDGTEKNQRCWELSEAECSLPIALEPVRQSESTFSRILGAVVAYLSNDSERYVVSAIVRAAMDTVTSPCSGELKESVARLEGGVLDLGPALAQVRSGDCELVLQPAGREDPTRAAEPVAVSYRWDPRYPAGVAVAGISPGLYEVGLSDRSSSAWVLIAAGADYPRLQSAFAEAESNTGAWHVYPYHARGFLRAYLDYLSGGR